MATNKSTSRQLSKPVSLKLTPQVESKLLEASTQTGLKRSDILRMSVDRGIDVLIGQLTTIKKAS